MGSNTNTEWRSLCGKRFLRKKQTNDLEFEKKRGRIKEKKVEKESNNNGGERRMR